MRAGWWRSVVVPYLVPLFAAATLFPRLLDLPGLRQVQLTELFFLPMLWVFRRGVWDALRRHSYLALALAVYVLVNLLSALWARDAGAIGEAGGRAYLAILALVGVAHLRAYGPEQLRRVWKWTTVTVAAGCLLAYVVVVGFGLSDPFRLVNFFGDYPYLGPVYRLRGPAQTYGMLYMLLLPGLLFAYRDWRMGRGRAWPWMLVAAAGTLTLSKENLLFPTAVLLLETEWGLWRYPAAAALAAVLLFGTHYLIVPTTKDLRRDPYAGRPVMTVGGYRMVESVYVPIKRAAWRAGRARPLLGHGPGHFATVSGRYATPGVLRDDFGPFDPHSTWLGAWAETGGLGLFALLALTIVLWRYGHPPRTVAVLLLLYLLVSVFKDVMNYRQLWLLMGACLAGRKYLCAPCKN